MESAEDTTSTVSSVEDAASIVTTFEGQLIAAQTKSQFDAVFKRAQEFARQIESDGSLGPLERGAVDQHLHELLLRARVDYDRNRDAARSALMEAADRLALAAESVAEAETVAQVQQVRSDLRLIRESLKSASAWAPRDVQARVWEQWQGANQAAWNKLNECWTRNEGALSDILGQAESAMEHGNPRAAKVQIKQFHELAKASESSHAAMKQLRVRARQLWDRAAAASIEQHEAYVVIARKRLDHLRVLAERAAQTRGRIELEVRALETNLQQAQTDVAAALLRGQLEARRKELRRLDSEAAGLVRRIDEAERVVR